MKKIQDIRELEDWHRQHDPWGYESSPEDRRRKEILLSEIPEGTYQRVLDIGCGQGFLTKDLPGEQIVGVDIAAEAIAHARRLASARLQFKQGSIFGLEKVVEPGFDLIVITGVLYPQYIAHALPTVYRTMDRLLNNGGLLLSVHIEDWYQARFPYLMLRQHMYPYREFTHRLELYVK